MPQPPDFSNPVILQAIKELQYQFDVIDEDINKRKNLGTTIERNHK